MALTLLREADSTLTRSPLLLAKCSLFQLLIVIVAVAMIWILLHALGEIAPVPGVFASYMISTLFRTISIVPGGLGIFEAAPVMSLKLIGVAVPAAPAATLLSRGLSFWLAMVPGFIFARSARQQP